MTTERIGLTQPIESRDGTFAKDSYSSNCVFETRDTKREFIKRPGLVYVQQIVPNTPPAVTTAQGLSSLGTTMIAVIDNVVYKNILYSGTDFTSVGTMSTSTSQSYFVKTFQDSYLFMHNKINGYVYSAANVFSAITNDKIVTINIDNSGIGYSEGITLSFSGGGGVAASATVVSGKITAVTITNYGTGLTATPTCTITKPSDVTRVCNGPGGSGQLFLSNTAGIYIGMAVTGTNVGSGAVVTGMLTNTMVLLSVPNLGSGLSGISVTFSDAGASGVLTPVLSQFPTDPLVSGAVFLDNYVFVGTSTNYIYNSNLGNPLAWNTGSDYIKFEQTGDTLVGIVKHLNYLIAMGRNSMQFFYDAGNAVGSPLAVSQSYTNEIGCANGDSIVATSNTVLWIGTSKAHGRSVYLMDGVSPVKISTDSVDKHIEADKLSKVTAYCYKFQGHTLYILTLHDTSKTLVYDIDEKMWYTWTQYAMASSDQDNPGTYYESYFRPSFYVEYRGTASTSGSYDNTNAYVLDDDTGGLYHFDVNSYSDNLSPIYCRTVTDVMDNGVTKRKFYGRLEIIGDKVNGVMQVRHSGDDYQTWSNYRAIDLSASRSQLYMGGSDRRRAWEFLVTSNVPLRLDAAEIDFRIGEMDQEQSVGGGRYRR
ncbi:hypothetical protein UFOVP38_14 [uncultured Caudovirales phage]|uniref:Bacteriophage P22, Gp10, DNA-stabilising n=1 Tax=uncultured Caudovirales phage TaxID=2100421 RepID=A0A6J5T7Q2_9CAUD|nr:hypothetical protein UFOVP38_14 [uncultured Caudovirales phage]